MPAHLVRRHYEHLRRRNPDATFKSLCAIFETSGAATARRSPLANQVHRPRMRREVARSQQ